MRRIWLALAAMAGAGAILAATPAPASAHPLGNFSVNQSAAVRLHPDRVEVAAAVDFAELPTLQEQPVADADRDGTVSAAERSRYAEAGCAAFADSFEASVDGRRLVWTVTEPRFVFASGAAGLLTSRLDCRLAASAPLAGPATVSIGNRFRQDRLGWRELTATGHGVRIVDSPVPARSTSDGLRAYPPDLLSSPPDVRSAELRVVPGSGSDAAAPADVESTGWTGAPARWAAAGEQALAGLVGERRLTPLVGILAILLAGCLGAGHAALPGHGKTVMAAYLAGRRGRPRDAVVIGATVTATHTGGVLVLGLLLTTVAGLAGLAGESVLGWLGVASGVLVVVVGLRMLATTARRRRHHHHHHDHDHHHHHHRSTLFGIGVAGGLVPSPSALVVLLGAIGLGRTGFGVLLVLAYGLGMAATLTAAGLVLIRIRDRLARRPRPVRWAPVLRRLSVAAPASTAGLVLLVGLGLAGRAAATLA